jgi:hypothetical protein
MYGPAWLVYSVLAVGGLIFIAGLLVIALVASYLTQFSQFVFRRCCLRPIRRRYEAR